MQVINCLFKLLLVWPTFSHPLDPALFSVKESAQDIFTVIWKTPVSKTAERPLRVVIPSACTTLTQEPMLSSSSVVQQFTMDCRGHGLRGSEIKIEGLSSWKTDALVRIEFLDGSTLHSVLRAGEESYFVPEQKGPQHIARDYVIMGIEHILFGWDHLLFVLGLVLLVRNFRSLLWTISAFTIGHSITLSLAALGVVHVSQAFVEVFIAASILVVALELVRVRSSDNQFKGVRHPPVIVIIFGLLHGLGFAGALAEVGLPETDIPLALLAFNIGIEIGQVLFVVAVLGVIALLGRLQVSWPKYATQIPAYVIGSLASFWIFDRITKI